MYLEEPGSVALVPALDSHGSRSGRSKSSQPFGWQVLGRDAELSTSASHSDPFLFSGPNSIQVFPNTGRSTIPGVKDIPVHGRAIHGVCESLTQVSFLRRYHPGINVPSRLLTNMILDDEQALIAQEDDGSDLVKCTTTILTSQHSSCALLVCVGGSNRNALCM